MLTQIYSVVVLDEIDHLVAVNQSEHLYWLFEIAQRANSSLIIIGIANALDLTETFLPRLESKSSKLCLPLQI